MKVLTDNIIVRGGPADDVVAINPGSNLQLTCSGVTYNMRAIGAENGSAYLQFLNNFWVAAQGSGGNDFVSMGIGTGQTLCYAHGMDGDDVVIGGGEGSDLYGGNQNDKIRHNNNIAAFAGETTVITGNDGDDCVESIATSCSMGASVQLNGGAGTDLFSSQGNASCRVPYPVMYGKPSQ